MTFLTFSISVLCTCLHGVTICVTPFDVQLIWCDFHAKWSPMLLIFCVMDFVDVLIAHDFFQNYLNHFCFDLKFSFMMIICELWNCLWLPLHMKCFCLMILMWSFLGYVNMCLKLHYVEFQLLFWIFSSLLTLGFDLVVWTYIWVVNFRFKYASPWLMLLLHLSLAICYCLLTFVCFVGFDDNSFECLPYGLLIVYIGLVCLLRSIDCCLFVWM